MVLPVEALWFEEDVDTRISLRARTTLHSNASEGLLPSRTANTDWLNDYETRKVVWPSRSLPLSLQRNGPKRATGAPGAPQRGVRELSAVSGADLVWSDSRVLRTVSLCVSRKDKLGKCVVNCLRKQMWRVHGPRPGQFGIFFNRELEI